MGIVLFLFGGINQASFAAEGDTIIYGANRDDNTIIEINLTQGTAQSVGTLAFGTAAMDQDPDTGYVYYFEKLNTGNRFAYWNPATGTNTIVRTYNPAPGFSAHRMAFRSDGTLFIMDDRQTVYRIDKQNGNITTAGRIGGVSPGWAGDIAFTPSGTPYMVTDRNLYVINGLQATLYYSGMIPNNADIVVWSGLAYCNSLLYASHIESNAAQTVASSAMYSINPNTGQVNELFDLPTYVNDLTRCSTTVSSNTPPVANNQSVSTTQNTPVAITLTATDADGNALTYSTVSGPSHGTLSGSAPNLTYTPNTGYTGSDSFTFKANDGTVDSNTATVSITVNPGSNTPPVAYNQAVTTDENTSVAFTLNASDAEGNPPLIRRHIEYRFNQWPVAGDIRRHDNDVRGP